MLKYRRFLPYLIVTPSQHVREKLKLIKPFFKDHHSPILESLEPQSKQNYPQEIYEPIFQQSDMYQLPEEHQEEILNHFSNTNIFPSQFGNTNLNPEPIEEKPIDTLPQDDPLDFLLQEQEIEQAIDSVSEMPDEAMNDSNAPIEEIIEEPVPIDDVDNLENMLDDPMQPDIMYDMEPMMPDPFHNPFYFNHMF